MIRRLLALASIATVLIAVIIVSQLREESGRVSGMLEADEIRVGSQVGGRVAQQPRPVTEGQRVTKGQVLVALEPFDLLERQHEADAVLRARQEEVNRLNRGFRTEEIAQAKARHEQLLAAYNELKNGPRQQEIEVAKSRLAVAQAELTLADQKHKRIRGLYEQAAASGESMDLASERLEAAKATVALREQELDLLLKGTRQEHLDQAWAKVQESLQAWKLSENGYQPEEIAAAEAARDAAEHARNAIRERAKELTIVSPLEDGVVEAIDLQPGDLVPPSTPVLTLVDDRHIWVRAYLPPEYLGLPRGQKLRVTLDSFPGEAFEGTIIFAARQAEFTPSNVQTPEERSKLVFRVKVALENPQRRLRPGMAADVWLPEVEPHHD
jgi:multidrug resistance efflux pump